MTNECVQLKRSCCCYSLGGRTAVTSLHTYTEAALCVLKCAVCEKCLLCICGTHFAALCTQIQLNLVRLCCPLTFKFHFGNFEHVVQRQQSSKINLGGVLYYMCLAVFILTWLTSIQDHIVGVLLFQTAVILWLMCSNPEKGSWWECWHGLQWCGHAATL